MKLTRLAATAAVAVLAATGLMAVSDLAQASPQHPGHFVANYPFKLGQSRIQGSVVDQFGNKVDDVSVHASSSSGSASQLTYARDGGGGHGFFNLSVRKGTYTITFNKKGYESDSVSGVKVGRQDSVSVGQITLQKKLISTNTTLEKDKCKNRHGKTICDVVVTVGGEDVKKPTGKISVGDQDYKLRPSDGGQWETTLVVTRTTAFVAKYKGDDKYDSSKSDALKIKA